MIRFWQSYNYLPITYLYCMLLLEISLHCDSVTGHQLFLKDEVATMYQKSK